MCCCRSSMQNSRRGWARRRDGFTTTASDSRPTSLLVPPDLAVVEALWMLSTRKKRRSQTEDVLGRGPLTDAMVRLAGPIATRMGEVLPKMRDRRRPSADDRPDVTPIQVEEIKMPLEVKRFVIRGPRALGRLSAQRNPFELVIAVCEESGELQALTRKAKSSPLDLIAPEAVMKILQRHPVFAIAIRPSGLGVCSLRPLKLLRYGLMANGHFAHWTDLLERTKRMPGRPQKKFVKDEGFERFYTVPTATLARPPAPGAQTRPSRAFAAVCELKCSPREAGIGAGIPVA